MKVFTSLMKTLITIVSLALTVMLVMTAAPLVTGGISIDSDGIEAELDGNTEFSIIVSGDLIIDSKLPKDIEDLEISIYMVADKPDITERLTVVEIGPMTIKSNTQKTISINGSVQIPSAVSFLLADNNNKEDSGIFLPLLIDFRTEYAGLIGLDLDARINVPLSETGKLESDVTKNSDGAIYKAQATFIGAADDLLTTLVPDEPMDVTIKAEGFTDEICINIEKNSITNEIQVYIKTGDTVDSVGIIELARDIIESDATISIDALMDESIAYSGEVKSEIFEEIAYYLSIYIGGIE